MGYILALLFIAFSIFLYSRNLFIKSKLDDSRVEYESLLSEKLQLERSYYRLKEERDTETTGTTKIENANQFNDSLKALKIQQEEEVAKLYEKIEELHQQLINYQKNK